MYLISLTQLGFISQRLTVLSMFMFLVYKYQYTENIVTQLNYVIRRAILQNPKFLLLLFLMNLMKVH